MTGSRAFSAEYVVYSPAVTVDVVGKARQVGLSGWCHNSSHSACPASCSPKTPATPKTSRFREFWEFRGMAYRKSARAAFRTRLEGPPFGFCFVSISERGFTAIGNRQVAKLIGADCAPLHSTLGRASAGEPASVPPADGGSQAAAARPGYAPVQRVCSRRLRGGQCCGGQSRYP